MTVEEAKAYMENEIRCIQRASYCDRDCAKCNLVKEEKPLLEAYGVAIQALEQVQQYRAIGTVEELKTAMKYVSLAKKHGTTGRAIDACAEYEAIGTVSEFRELKEKATAKKVVEAYGKDVTFYLCPSCEKVVANSHLKIELRNCSYCSQKLDWSEGKE